MSGRSGSEGSSTTTAGGGAGLKRGPWTTAEDAVLVDYVRKYGEGNWNSVHRTTGLSRCGKSCRLRWANHLRPNLKKGSFSPEEERLVLELHARYGNKWAHMAAQLPGRTDNEIKNFWNTRIKRRQRSGLPMYPPDINSGFCKLPTYQTNYNTQYATKSSFNGNLIGFDDALLSDIEQRPKRLRVDNGIRSLSCYNLGIFDVGMQNIYPILQQPQLSMQVGLPSSQLISLNGYKYGYETDISPLNHDNSGLLQSVLDGVRGSDSKLSTHNSNSHMKPLIDDLKQSSFNVSDNELSHSTVVSGMAIQSGTMDDDLSALIGILHPSPSPAPLPAKWEEAECKGSATVNRFLGATDSSIPKLEMQPTSNEEQAWNIASCHWKNIPRIC